MIYIVDKKCPCSILLLVCKQHNTDTLNRHIKMLKWKR